MWGGGGVEKAGQERESEGVRGVKERKEERDWGMGKGGVFWGFFFVHDSHS